eukprot:jgi/Hompol1/5606/HPOL_002230-RA
MAEFYGDRNNDDDDDNDNDESRMQTQAIVGAWSRAKQDAETDLEAEEMRLPLKRDHALRPLWVCSSGRIVAEAFALLFREAHDFLAAVAEPLSRPARMLEFRLTEHSLYAAVSVGLAPESIVAVLDLLSKCELPPSLVGFIHSHTRSYGKLKLLLRHNRYWLQTLDQSIYNLLLANESIAAVQIAASPSQPQSQLQQHQRQPADLPAVVPHETSSALPPFQAHDDPSYLGYDEDDDVDIDNIDPDALYAAS